MTFMFNFHIGDFIIKTQDFRFEVLMSVTMKSANACDVMPFILVEAYQHFRGSYCPYI
jgi:hypothetical protein